MKFNKYVIFSLFSAAVVSGLMTPLRADITVRMPKGSKVDKLEVQHYPISRVSTANNFKELGVVEETIPVENGIAKIKIDDKDCYVYRISSGNEINEVIFTDKGDDLLVEIASIDPYYSVVSGSEVMDGITALNQSIEGLHQEMLALRSSGMPVSAEKVDSIRNEVYTNFIDFIEENPTSPVVAYAVTQLDDERFLHYSSRLSEGVKASILYPLVESRLKYIAAEKEKEEKLQQFQSGAMDAPSFSLEDLKGEFISLSSFKGKWVILDFWGSWCVWCIKGFPELKEAYQKYAGKLEVIGIDCRESKEDWRAGVRKYELPWVNLYCPEGNSLLREYGVQGFPTKAIIDPEGKIRNVTVGHNPEFYTILDTLMGE